MMDIIGWVLVALNASTAVWCARDYIVKRHPLDLVYGLSATAGALVITAVQLTK